jgi:RimJ/RimL family protein N-acetyltransferase
VSGRGGSAILSRVTTPELARLWPAAGLRARAGAIELRWIDDELLLQIADLAARGIHDDDRMPFAVPWTRGTPEEVARSVLVYEWNARTQVTPDRLVLELAVLVDGVPVGIQSATAGNWKVLRKAETGSWLGREHQGAGIGTRMRVLMLELLFDGLGAAEVTSGAFTDNPASGAVSRKVGYLDNGAMSYPREGHVVEHLNYRMLRSRWDEVREQNALLLGAPVELEGAAELTAFLDGS